MIGHIPGAGIVVIVTTASSLAPAHCGKVVLPIVVLLF